MAERTPGQELLERRMQRRESHADVTWGEFIKELCRRGTLEKEEAGRAATSVLCLIEQRLTSGEAKDLESQLPMRLKEMLVRCPRHEGRPPEKFGADAFLRMVSQELGVDEVRAESVTRAVFSTLRSRVSEGEWEQVAGQLPHDLRAFWMLEA